MEGLGFTEIASLYLLLLVLEYGHRRLHAQEAKLPIEGLFARHSIQDDLLVTARDFDQMSYDLLAQSGTLMTRQCGDVADVRAICSIGERSALSNGFSSLFGAQRLCSKRYQLSFLQRCAGFVAQRFFVGRALVQVGRFLLAFGSNSAVKRTRILRAAYIGR